MLDEDKLRSVMAIILEVDASEINEGASMDNLAAWDSIKHMDIILALEEEFGISIPDEEAGDLTSYKLIKVVLSELLDAK